MSRKVILYTFTVARQKINTETTQEFLIRKPPTIFHNFKFHIRRTQQKSPSFSKVHIGLSQQHCPEPTTFEVTRRISHTMIINYLRNPYNENDSRSSR